MPRKIEVVDYRPEWAAMFKEEAKKIRKILGKNCIGIYHIGSTSVKDLPAKPVIDIMPVVKDISLVDAHNKEFEDLGYDIYISGSNSRLLAGEMSTYLSGRFVEIPVYPLSYAEYADQEAEWEGKLDRRLYSAGGLSRDSRQFLR